MRCVLSAPNLSRHAATSAASTAAEPGPDRIATDLVGPIPSVDVAAELGVDGQHRRVRLRIVRDYERDRRIASADVTQHRGLQALRKAEATPIAADTGQHLKRAVRSARYPGDLGQADNTTVTITQEHQFMGAADAIELTIP